MVKHLSTMQETQVRAWVGKIPWRRKWQSTPVLLPGESHGQRSLVGYSLWGHKESDMTERLQSVSQSNRYLQSTYCVAGSISGTGNIVENMKGKLSIKDLANYLKKVSEKIYTYNI